MNHFYTPLILSAAISLFASLSANVQGAPITVPSDLNVGDKYRLAFVTSTTRNALSSDIEDYNAFVTAAANSVPELLALGTNWKAIGSTLDDDARDNTGTNPNISNGDPIYRLDDTRMADDNADLWDESIQAPLSINEFGSLSITVHAWTGSDGTGIAHINSPVGPPPLRLAEA